MTIDEAIQFIVSCGLVVPGRDLKQLKPAPQPPSRRCHSGLPSSALGMAALLDKPAWHNRRDPTPRRGEVLMSRDLRLGTPASLLAQWQAQWVAAELHALGVEVELVP